MSNNEISKFTSLFFRKRKFIEFLFKSIGLSAILISCLFLVTLLSVIVYQGYTGFYSHQIKLEISVPDSIMPKDQDAASMREFRQALRLLIYQSLESHFPDVLDTEKIVELRSFVGKKTVKDLEIELDKHPKYINRSIKYWLGVSSDLDLFLKDRNIKEFSKDQIQWTLALVEGDWIKAKFNSQFFNHGDSREPEMAGVKGSILGSLLLVLVTISVALPLAIATALYLEEFAPKNRYTDFIEVSINNLAAVPSIVYGLLGLAVFLGFFALPRSSILVGGLTLSLLILPTIIMTTRQAIKSIPPSIKQGLLAIGATPMQIVFHHTLPLALPGIMTGVILAISRAIGETAPLIMIGMVAFIADIPKSVLDPATVIPVQIYLWADSPEAGYLEKTASAIIILLFVLFLINSLAIYLRKKYEKRW